jgi:hypothetical protein
MTATMTRANPRQVPDLFNPMDALLQAFESQVEAMKANDLVPQLCTMLVRLLPLVPAVAVPVVPAPVPAPGANVADPNRELDLTRVLTAFNVISRRTRFSDSDSRCIAQARAFVEAELAICKAKRPKRNPASSTPTSTPTRTGATP